MRGRRREAGFTILEAIVSMACFAAIGAGFIGIVTRALGVRSEQSSLTTLLTYATHAFSSMEGQIREGGRVTLPISGGGSRTYPYLYNPGPGGTATAIAVVHPQDMDGDGLPTSATTGQVEWGPTEYQFVVQAASGGGNQLVELQSGTTVKVLLARNVDRMEVYDDLVDPSLGINQVRVKLFLTSPDLTQASGISVVLESVITMRNMPLPSTN